MLFFGLKFPNKFKKKIISFIFYLFINIFRDWKISDIIKLYMCTASFCSCFVCFFLSSYLTDHLGLSVPLEYKCIIETKTLIVLFQNIWWVYKFWVAQNFVLVLLWKHVIWYVTLWENINTGSSQTLIFYYKTKLQHGQYNRWWWTEMELIYSFCCS